MQSLVMSDFQELSHQKNCTMYHYSVKSSGPNSSPDLNQQGYSVDTSDPGAPRLADLHLERYVL